MRKYTVFVTRKFFAEGTYEIEAPDLDAAYVLAEDILLNDPRITWDEPKPGYKINPDPDDITIPDSYKEHSR